MHKLAILDVDGTILDTSYGLLSSARYVIQELGYTLPSKEILLSFVGPRIQDSLDRVFGLEGKELKCAANIFRNHYKEKDVLKAKPYDGIYEVLRNIKERGIHIAVATNKRQDFTDALMDAFGFGQYVERAFGTDAEGKLRKDDLIQICLDYFRIPQSSEAVMIGDSSYDAIAAEKTGVNFIGVTYGFEFRVAEDVGIYRNIGIAGSVAELGSLCQKL